MAQEDTAKPVHPGSHVRTESPAARSFSQGGRRAFGGGPSRVIQSVERERCPLTRDGITTGKDFWRQSKRASAHAGGVRSPSNESSDQSIAVRTYVPTF